MLRTTLISTLIVMTAALVTTPAMSASSSTSTHRAAMGSGDDRPSESIMLGEPPDPCIQFKGRTAHEQCVTRQMNMNAIHGACDGGGMNRPMMRNAAGAQMEMGTGAHCLNPQPLPPG